MDAGKFLPEKFQSGLEKDLLLVLVSVLIVGISAGVHNLTTPEDPKKVGLVEVDTECTGFEAGVCIGLERQTHTTYNYDNYSEPEPGTPNYYRLAESELMAQAYNICESENVTEFEWTSEAQYLNQTGDEWRSMEEVQLLPCEETFYRDLETQN